MTTRPVYWCLRTTPGALADAIIRLLDEPDLARTLADGGLASAEQKFTVGRYRREIAEAIGALLPS